MRSLCALAALVAVAAPAAATQTTAERLAERRCAAIHDEAAHRACLERVGRTIQTFQDAERGSR